MERGRDKTVYKTNLIENKDYLENQILTYIGNKRTLLSYIGKEIKLIQRELNKEKLETFDIFSGSGIVARYLKQFSSKVYANDLEQYSEIINQCYLSNNTCFDKTIYDNLLKSIQDNIIKNPIKGIISENYSPKDDKNIKKGERVFYTRKNAIFIDSFRYYIENIVPKDYKKYFLARLITEASVHVNTSGVFKGFYKDKETGLGKFGGTAGNALSRITGDFDVSAPVLSNFQTESCVFREDANIVSKKVKNLDITYLDPPYNQHPYGSNYFMLNLILDNKMPSEISKVSGIPTNWNHSIYNKKQTALNGLEDIVSNLDSKYCIFSYNNEGFISKEDMEKMLSKYGNVKTTAIEYNTFRGCRNLRERNLKTREYLFVLKKR